jgi:predicted dehydrogenase
MEKVRVAVVGAGGIAQVAHIPVWKKLPDVELVAVCDTIKARAKAVAEKYKIPRYYTRDEEALKQEDIDAVDICVPTNMHEPIAVKALSAGKHVLVEKPMSRTVEEAERMVRAARQYKRNLMVAMNVRFRWDAVNLKSFVEGGELGEVFYAKSGWLRRQSKWSEHSWLFQKKYSGGGVLMDLGIQMLDVTLWLLENAKAKSVKANLYNQVAKLDVEDAAVAFVHLENGATLTLEVSWTFLTEEDLLYTNLFGTRGGALLNPLRVMKEMHGNLVNLTPSRTETSTNLYKHSYENEIRHFVKCLRDNHTPMMSSGEESLERMRIIEAMYESAKRGKEVSL